EVVHWLNGLAAGSDRFCGHCARWEVEAWLLPFWADICRRLKLSPCPAPPVAPEEVDGDSPPSRLLTELYRRAKRTYEKPIEAPAILAGKDLAVAAASCPTLKSFLESLLRFAGCPVLL